MNVCNMLIGNQLSQKKKKKENKKTSLKLTITTNVQLNDYSDTTIIVSDQCLAIYLPWNGGI